MKTELKEILHPLNQHIKYVDEFIIRKLETGMPDIDESAIHLFKSGGKRIRASLVILSSGIKGEVPDGVIELAGAAEIVHAATLIHDDIIDQSLLRRGNETVSRIWGNKISVLTGDYMYTTALGVAMEDGNPDIFPLMVNGTIDMVKGELYQLQYSSIDSIDRQHYFKIIELKTARFMAACAKLGAVKAGFSKSECDSLYNFGINIGFAFQIIDDTLDLMESGADLGKDVGNDLKEGKITLPFIYIMEIRENASALLKDFINKTGNVSFTEIEKIIHEHNAIEYSIDIAGSYINKALQYLEIFEDSEYRKILYKLSDFFLSRKF